MARVRTYRAAKLIQAAKTISTDRRRFLTLREDGYVLRRDAERTAEGWHSAGWKLFSKRKEEAPWPEFARDFVQRLRTGGYQVTFIGPRGEMDARGFTSKLRASLEALSSPARALTTTSTDATATSDTMEAVRAHDRSRYRLWACPSCGQKIRAATDKLKVGCIPCRKAFISLA